MGKRNSVKHIRTADPAECWRTGVLGFITRLRGIAATVATKAAAAGSAFWFAHVEIGIAIVVVSVFSVSCIWFLRTQFLKRMDVDAKLHTMFHELRDTLPILLNQKPGSRGRAVELDKLSGHFVRQVAGYYRKLKCDDSINSALRILNPIEQNFVTRARSDGMDSSRKANSVAIPSDKGLANALRQNDSQGVYLIPSINAAIEAGIWMPTPTDKYPDVKSLMVVPVNGIEGSDHVMVGMLYVTAKSDVFASADTHSIKAFADALGMVLSVIASSENSEKSNG